MDLEDEKHLVERSRSSSAKEREQAFKEIHAKFGKQILGLSLHLTGRQEDAEDALQEVLLAMHLGLRSFKGKSRLSTWIYRITIRSAHRVRKRTGHERLDRDSDSTLSKLSVNAPNYAEIDSVRKAMRTLPAESRIVLSLFALEELSHKEISDILNVPEGTVWSRLHKAKKMLEKNWKQLNLIPSKQKPLLPQKPNCVHICNG